VFNEYNQRPGREIVLEDVKKLRSTFKEASNVFRSVQRHDSRHNEVIFDAEERWLSRGNVLERVFQLWQELRVFLAQRIPKIH